MRIPTAVITAASPQQPTLPLQRLVDRDGVEKSALQMIVEEVLDAGVERVVVVICPGRQSAFEQAAGPHADRIAFLEQETPRGYGDALFRARSHVGDDAFLHLVSDHLYLSRAAKGCARQLVELAQQEQCSVSGVQPTHERMLPYFGTVGGRPVPRQNNLYTVERVVEKPTPTQAEQNLFVSGLRAGHYLCLFGMHVLTPRVMELLAEDSAASKGDRFGLTSTLNRLAAQERYLALEVDGVRYDLGLKYGLLTAQLALGLAGRDREQILRELVELLALRPFEPGAEG